MKGPSSDTIYLTLFFAGLLGAVLAELYFLSKRNASIRRAMVFVFSSVFVTITVGFFISFIIFALLLMATSDENNKVPGGEAGSWAALALTMLVPFGMMFALRRLLFPMLRLDAPTLSPTSYSLLSTIAFFLSLTVFPLLYYVIFRWT